MQNKIITFIASLPDILSAISLSGVDGNSRIKLDIPASDIETVIKLTELRGQAFKVTIEKIEDDYKKLNPDVENLDLME